MRDLYNVDFFHAPFLLGKLVYDDFDPFSLGPNQVLEQILGVLIKLVKDLKLQHQHKYVSISNLLIYSIVRFCWYLSLLVYSVFFFSFFYIRFSYPSWIELTVFSLFLKDDLQKTWLCKRCEIMSTKLRSVVPVAVISNMFCAISVAFQLR